MHSCFGFSPAGHVISSTLEHAAVFQTLKELQAAGVDVSFLEGGAWGAVTADAVQKAITPSTRLISLMAVNNETGVLTDIDKRGRACIRHN
jgi:cysteine desulfurase